MKLSIAQAAKLASAALPTRIILSKAPKAAQYRRCTFELKGGAYHISRYSQKQAFHQNIAADELERALCRRSFQAVHTGRPTPLPPTGSIL